MTINGERGIPESALTAELSVTLETENSTADFDSYPTAEEAEEEDAITEVSRGMRDLRYADLLDTARTKTELLEPIEKYQIVDSLERRKWGGTLRNLEEGDTVVSVLASTSDLLSIKNLNDNIFGPQTTNKIIIKRRKLIEKAMNMALNLAGVPSKELEHISLEQNYKFGIYKIPKKYNLDTVAIVKKVCADVDKKMKDFIIYLADIEQSKFPEKTTKLQNFRGAVNVEGYRMTFGTAIVETDELEDVILAVNGSLQTARSVASDNSIEYGDKFSTEKMTTKIEETNNLRVQIIDGGNQIIGKDGIAHSVFIQTDSGLCLNKNLLREVRKDKFVVNDNQLQILRDIKNYIKGLNIFDTVKPFTADEVEELKDEINKIDKIIQGVMVGNQDQSRLAAEKLDRNEKDERFTSEARFHAEAVKIKNCAYLSLDVLDIGIDQLLDFEQRTQQVATKQMTFTEASLTAGDAMTKRLRDFREKAFKICEEYGLTKDGRMNGLVGGDELTLAIDLDAVNKDGEKIFTENDEVLNKLIYRLKKETSNEETAGIRVVKTVIAESKRHSATDNVIYRMNEHLMSLKNAEEGAHQAKEIENEMRKLAKFIKKRPDDEAAKVLFKNLKNFVMSEIDGNFVIRTETGPDLNMAELQDQLKFIYS